MEGCVPASLFSFGLIADIQYADIDNRPNFTQTCIRYYRNGLALLKDAIQHWTSDGFAAKPDFVVQLGDILDGFNTERGKAQSLQVLETILGQFDRLPCTVHHVFGNHEFYNFSRVELMSRLFSGADFETTPRDPTCQCFPDDLIPTNGFGSEEVASYYHFSPAAGFRFIILDTFAKSIIGHDKKCPIGQESLRLVSSVNGNEDLNSPVGLVGPERRFVQFNGGLGEKQMEWLEEVLQKALCAEEKVIVFGHAPIYPLAGYYSCLQWDYPEALQLLRSFPCVVAAIAGHTHDFLHTVDDISGIHFLTLPGIVEIQPGSNGFGTIQVYEDKLVLHGVGKVGDLEMMFP